MGIRNATIPVCDKCGWAWLPVDGPAREDIRGYDAHQRALGDKGKPVRCGKCKTDKWDEKHRKSLENGEIQPDKVADFVQKLPMPVIPQEVFAEVNRRQELTQVIAGGRTPKLCRHRVVNCPICT